MVAPQGILDFPDAQGLYTPSVNRGILYQVAGVWYRRGSDGVDHVLEGVPDTRQIIAGAGLTGGGDFTADRTLDIAALDATVDVQANGVKVLDSPKLNNQLPAFYLARANHTGSQAAATISDFDTQVRTSRLDQMAAPTGPVNMGNQKLSNLLAGTASTDAVNLQQLTDAVTGLLDNRGTYDASTNLFPAAGGSGTAGAILKSDFWVISVGGTLGGSAVTAGDWIYAKVDTPGQTAGNWAILQANLTYAPEDVANKSTDGTMAANSATLYPSQSAAKAYADAKVVDSIADADTARAPSRNAVFDALALKQPLATPLTQLAGLSPSASDFFQFVGGVWTNRTPAQAKTSLAITDADVDYTEGTSQVVGTQANFNVNLNRHLFNLLNYIGASFAPDDGVGGGTDVAGAFNVITALLKTAKGGKIVLPNALMRHTTTLLVNYGIEVEGPGCGANADVGNWRDALGCAFIWRGALDGTQMDAFPSDTGGSAQGLKNLHLHGFSFDGRGNLGTDVGSVRAGRGLRLRSSFKHNIHDLFFIDQTIAALETGALTAGTIGEAHDCSRGHFDNIGIRVTDLGGAGGTVAPGQAVVLGGTSSANTCFNTFENFAINYLGSNTGKPALDLVNTDSNVFDNWSIFNAGGGLTNWGAVVRGSNSSVQETSRANVFRNFAPGSAGMILCGTAAGIRPDLTADATFNFTNPSANNRVDENTENGEPFVYRGTGVIGPFPGASGGSTFSEQGFASGGSPLKTTGPAALISNAELTIISMTLPKWYFAVKSSLILRSLGVLIMPASAATITIRLKVGGQVWSVVLTNNTIARSHGTTIECQVNCTAVGATGSHEAIIVPSVAGANNAATGILTLGAHTAPASKVINTNGNITVDLTLQSSVAATAGYTPAYSEILSRN